MAERLAVGDRAARDGGVFEPAVQLGRARIARGRAGDMERRSPLVADRIPRLDVGGCGALDLGGWTRAGAGSGTAALFEQARNTPDGCKLVWRNLAWSLAPARRADQFARGDARTCAQNRAAPAGEPAVPDHTVPGDGVGRRPDARRR